jgi:hypothetical protein
VSVEWQGENKRTAPIRLSSTHNLDIHRRRPTESVGHSIVIWRPRATPRPMEKKKKKKKKKKKRRVEDDLDCGEVAVGKGTDPWSPPQLRVPGENRQHDRGRGCGDGFVGSKNGGQLDKSPIRHYMLLVMMNSSRVAGNM